MESMAVLSVIISGISLIAGIFWHYVFVRVRMAELKLQLEHHENRLNDHKNAMPELIQMLGQVQTDIAVIKSKLERQ